jgi:hypothetical protein
MGQLDKFDGNYFESVFSRRADCDFWIDDCKRRPRRSLTNTSNRARPPSCRSVMFVRITTPQLLLRHNVGPAYDGLRLRSWQ